MNKQFVYKMAKTFFWVAGFPMMLVMMLITLSPMFDADVMGNYAAIWITVFFVLWAVFEAVRFLLNRFVGSRGETQRRICVLATAVLAVVLVLVPSAIFDAAYRSDYEKDYSQLTAATDVKSYDKLMGWHRGFTSAQSDEVHALIDSHYDFVKQYGLSGTESGWYGNADKENGVGYKYGSFEMADVLYAEKLAAVDKLAAAKAELAAIEARQAELQAAYDAAVAEGDADKIAETKTALDEYLASVDADLVRLKGERLDISSVKPELVKILVAVINDVLKGEDGQILNSDWTVELLGQRFSVKGLVDYIVSKIPGGSDLVGGLVTEDLIDGVIPDVIYTGIGSETITSYENAIEGGGLLSLSDDMSLAQVESLRFKMNHYPQVLAAAAVKYAAYIFVGIIVLCVFATDFFSRKEKEVQGGEHNE